MPDDIAHSCVAEGCDLPDDEDMVSCETCARWWHYGCAKFDPSLYDTATPWFCRTEDCDEVAKGQEGEKDKSKPVVSKSKSSDDYSDAIDALIEAAKLAQTTVDQKESEIELLKAEMNALKSSLLANTKQPSVPENPRPVGLTKLADDRLAAVHEIGCKHKQILENKSRAHSTPHKAEGNPGSRSSDSDTSLCQQSDMANLLTILTRNQVQELPLFSGQDHKEWPYFESVYKSTTEEGRYNSRENVSRLRKALVGEAHNLVSDRLRYSTDSDAIMNTLRAIYGRSDVLVHNLTTNLLKLPTLSSGIDMKLRHWAVSLNGFVGDINSMNLGKELNNNYVLTDLAGKLCPSLYHDWQKQKIKNPNVNLEDFAIFISAKLLDLPPELSRSPKAPVRDKAVGAAVSRRVLTHQPVSDAIVCIKCTKSGHKLSECDVFKALKVDERFEFAKENAICFRCLDPVPHKWNRCSQRKFCGIEGCSRHHHPLLHSTTPRSSLNSLAPPFTPPAQIHSSHLGVKAPVMFKVVPIRLYGSNDRYLDTYAFLDDGSSITMIERDVYDFLDLKGEPESLVLQWTKGVSRTEESMRTTLSVSAVSRDKRFTLKDIYTVRGLELPSQSVNVSTLQKSFAHLKNLPLFELKDAKPKTLLGLDQAKLLSSSQERSGKDDEPRAIKTPLGWVVFGTTGPQSSVSCLNSPKITSISYFHGISKQDEELHELVKRHFSTEEFGVKPPSGDFVSRSDKRALDIMERTLCQVNGQYEVGLLWDSDEAKLPQSYGMAERRLVNFEKTLLKNPDLMKWMTQYMEDLVTKGYARIATAEELKQDWKRIWYVPIFIVLNKNKCPPKPRVVADFAAKVDGTSLNSRLLKGPDNLVPLHAGLFKFRERKFAVNADVKEMFHRIRIREEDQQCQRVLWRDCDSSRKPTVFVMQVMMFGPHCSPFSAQFVKNYHASLYKTQCPEAVDGLVNRTYVDDYFNSHDTLEEAVSVSNDAIRICKTMNFDLVGFQSNSRSFLNQIPQTNIKANLVSIDPDESDNYVTKILGMFWNPSSDELIYKLNDEECLNKISNGGFAMSKREVLRTIMRIFDPLGLVSCFIIKGRVILQEIWREGSGWDDPISDQLKVQWLEFIRDIRRIECIKIPRAYASWSPDSSRISLIVFVDASEKAFAAVCYWRFESKGTVDVAIVMAKAKVAPVKKLSVPRLELQAAVLGTRIAETVKNSHSIKPHDVIFLSDSKTVLSWICSSNFKFPSFVAVRIGEILDVSNPTQWFYVRSSDNVADDGTRWREMPEEIDIGKSRWFTGPNFLKLPRDEWPVTAGNVASSSEKVSDLVSSIFSIHLHTDTVSFKVYDELKGRFRASWFSAIRVLAFLLRFKDLLRRKPIEKEPFVTPFEILRAQDWVFRKIQQEAFPNEISSLKRGQGVAPTSCLSNLSPFIDDEGTVRLSSRAQKANLSYAALNPAILPKTHPLVDMLIMHHHQTNFHRGTETTIMDIRERAWIISIRVAVARVQSRCFMCRRLKAKPVMPLMGQLPEGRLAFDLRPFTHVGVDCFGPMYVKHGRGTAKRYGMIFTCLSFRAVHIEVLNDLSMDQCIMGLRRFLINRVVTKFIYSDNGLNFVGTRNCLEKDYKEMEKRFSEYCAKYEGIVWKFIPAYSPWMGGAWERLIKSIKSSTEFILRGVTPREDVLVNALLEAQGQINRRPLTHLPVDPEDPRPLTPNSILFGDSDRDFTAPGNFIDGDNWSRLYSRRAQHLMRSFTKRWYQEYLPEITRRSKWHKNIKPVQIGSIVLVIQPEEIRSAWRMGRVTKVYPGSDGIVRIADVRLANGVLLEKRSVGRLAVLDLESSHTASDGARDVIEQDVKSGVTKCSSISLSKK